MFLIIFLFFTTNVLSIDVHRENLTSNEFTLKKHNVFFYKGQTQGCQFKENANESLICYGPDCKNYPSNYEVHKRYYKIKMTSIKEFKKDDFVKLGSVTVFIIQYNTELFNFEPECFAPMKNLLSLKIVLNQNLHFLHENVFEGLNKLKILNLKKNGFKYVSYVTQALTAIILPNLYSLDLSENSFSNILEDDFSPMIGTNVQELLICLCGTEYIHEKSLIIFKKLTFLDLSQNHFNKTTIVNVILNFVKYSIPLDNLQLNDLGYRKNPPYELMEAIANTNITTLSLADNQLEQIDFLDFPIMPKIKSLDLTNNIIISIEDNAFDSFPNLEALYLAENKFSKIHPAILLPKLKTLDLRMISNKAGAISYFNIEGNIFQNMSNLIDLKLSYNLIETTNKYTFIGLDNLRNLELKNATLFNVETDSFKTNKKLTYLNLENNPLQAITLTYESFRGLGELKTLLLGGCNIYNLSLEPSPFCNLKNLTYLGLNNNVIYTLTPNVFAPLVSLQTLDLSNNKLLPWNKRLFSNISLKTIDVSQNKFTFLTKEMLEDFQTMDNINLDGNPFVCDCNFLPQFFTIDTLIKNYNTNIIDVICTNLGWEQKSVYDYLVHLKDNMNECNLKPNNKVVTISLSTVFIIIFTASSILLYIYRFYVRYWLFLFKMALQRRTKWYKTDNQITFKYDAFVSYSCLDCYFVNKLVTELEDNEPHLKLCVYERDFKIGSVISEEVLQSVLKSKRTLLIISDGFAKSQWCRWETKLAEYHQLFFKNDDGTSLDDTLVMIKLNDVPKKYITPTLKYLMKTRIYLIWDPENEKEFWEKLRNTLASPKRGQRMRTLSQEETVL